MIVEMPFVFAEDIAEDFRHGRTSTKSSLETLRKHRVLSDGLFRALPAAGGRKAGTLRLYSTLSRDAAAMQAAGRHDAAVALADAARQLEGRAEARVLADALAVAAAAVPSPGRSLRKLFVSIRTDPQISVALRDYLRALADARRSLPNLSTAPARVKSVQRDVAKITFLDGGLVPLPLSKIPYEDLAPGDPLLIRWSDLGRGMWMVADSALELDDTVADMSLGERYPFVLPMGHRPVVPAAILEGPPKVRRRRAIPITE